MPIQWHHDYHPTVARKNTGPYAQGGIRITGQGRGRYHFGVDHNPHNNNLLTNFAASPAVHAFDRDGRRLGQVRTRLDRYRDKNVVEWNSGSYPNTAYYEVRYELDRRSVASCARNTGFHVYVKFARV